MYKSKLNIFETQKAIENIKILFPKFLSEALSLTRATAPLFVEPLTGLNDTLNGEAAVSFVPKGLDTKLEIVHSLAKWKRYALREYDFYVYKGLYTDMNAIRKEEILSPFHSYYVDQWDWEKIIKKEDRNLDYLKQTVKTIYDQIRKTEEELVKKYPQLKIKLPKELVFIDSQELEDLYPELSPSERETKFSKEKAKAFFVIRVGWKLKSGQVHSSRAIDYDDWNLNGDLIFYHETLDKAIEISSMGIRVDAKALLEQSKLTKLELEKKSKFHNDLVNENLPFSIGGGIGQSRLCMFLLEKAHIGEVQSSYWPKEILEKTKKENIILL
ncbi:aspartate--ammonia ligase [Mycoplasma sp. 1654_15]|uniref:aspartate--ammonia ligase n=1 Tax=Mycoplasma sp. 1654_15 TaxID=2725994 RepID=UPI0014493A9C|nr:aspartate--ammonia ligase [Mycoplasma sp. 1654_15]QJB71463.1 aspartate--ammonia ligase [Mycoplasma sp. 1654_15]